MPILTPCADTDPASNTPQAATRADTNFEFILASQKASRFQHDIS
jgi:hypothetical protein